MAAPPRERTMQEYVRPTLNGATLSIVKPNVAVNYFEIKPNIIQMVQKNCMFNGLPNKDTNTHLDDFLDIYDMFKINRVSYNAIRLKLFPFLLKDKPEEVVEVVSSWNIYDMELAGREIIGEIFSTF
eukprot:XP_015571048.1 uncharacterized protein LOC107260819 [Ricinus communis]